VDALTSEAAGKTIEVWFQDEARVGQQGTLSYVWAPIGSRPARVRDCRHESAYLFGAICPARAVGAARQTSGLPDIVMPWVSSEAMTIHLAEISKQVSASAHALLVCDGAGWHQPGVRLTVPDNITLLRLPPYAPELNPIENVWEYLRGNALSMTVWESYTAIVDACCDAWNGLMKDAERIASLTTRDWAQVKT
jgi:DDE superfamily endonuclease